MAKTFLEDVASRCRLYMAGKLSHMGVEVDGLACPMYHPMTYIDQTGGTRLPVRRCLVLLLQWVVVPFRKI
jgi:hypothetical protein